MEIASISRSADSMTSSSRPAAAENTISLSWISLAVSEMFSAWSEIRSKSEMVWRNLLTSSLWALDRERLVIFMR